MNAAGARALICGVEADGTYTDTLVGAASLGLLKREGRSRGLKTAGALR
jgi:hypothetical protein